MSSLVSGQLSAAKTGWLVALLFFGWLGYLLVPAPKPESKPAPSPVTLPPSRLVALGLPDNPDLEHLPEFFAVYADQAEWKDDKTLFAYWNPGSNSYSYYFEATRTNGKIHFRETSKKELFLFREFYNETGDYVSSDYIESEAKIEKFVFTTGSSSHPFILFKSQKIPPDFHGKMEQPQFDEVLVRNPPPLKVAPFLPADMKKLSPTNLELKK